MNSKTKTAMERLTERIAWFLESDDATLEDLAEVVGRQEAKALLNAARDAMMGEEILDLIAYNLPSKGDE
jgi:hypothetical protein